MKTTIEISDPLLAEAKRVAAEESTTLRELVESGLRAVLKQRRGPKKAFRLEDARVAGRGLRPEAREAGWDKIRDGIYQGRGG